MLVPYSLILILYFGSALLSLFDFYERRHARMELGWKSFSIATGAVVLAIVYVLIGRMHAQNVTINYGFAAVAVLAAAGTIWQLRAPVPRLKRT